MEPTLELLKEQQQAVRELFQHPGWEIYLNLWNDLMKQYGGVLQSSKDLQVEVPRAQGALEVLTKLHNRMIEFSKDEELEDVNG